MYQVLVAVAILSMTVTQAFASAKESRAAGEATYHASGCQQCHGKSWDGTEKGPDLHGVGKRLQRDALTKQLRDGGGGMPAFGAVLTEEQIGQLVEFLETQKKPRKHAKPKDIAKLP